MMVESSGPAWGRLGWPDGLGGPIVGRYSIWLIVEWPTGGILCGSTIGRYSRYMMVEWMAGW